MISRETQSNFSCESLTGKNKRQAALLLCVITGSHSGPKLPEASHQTDDFNTFRETRSCKMGAPRNLPAEVERGAVGAVYRRC